ncbi:YuzF family protein [Oceanirhabdus sp. W0125-5]|uniref:YuzF family protein n=1 Tax=Oceanirhabdus sp. W0125-5 TaxID=2999116 RepID=UPI0022F2F57E|nr:YuzF family protein [Oceanirhabdus sp. W0125-5]WBW98981.1 YuzF family protein [Oceanirhabdus sp. W0125-5]
MNYDLYQRAIIRNMQQIEYATIVEPYFVETLEKIIGESVVIETIRGNLQGILADVKPDHVVVKSYDGDTEFYLRIQQIVHVMPI